MSWERLWKMCLPNFLPMPTTPQIKVMLVALIAPECMVIWALRQCTSAKEIVRENKGQYHLNLEADAVLHHPGLTMNSAFFSIMGGFVITDRERNPIQVLVLHPSHLNDDYFKNLLPAIIKVDDHIKAYLKVLITNSLEMSVTADTTDNRPKEFPDADAVVDEIVPILMTVIFKIVLESELFQLVLTHKAAVQLLAMNMATEAVEIAFPIIEMSMDLTREKFKIKLRDRLGEKLPERLRGINKVLETDIQGRSKQDSLAKTFALVQTTWFVTQCIARKAQHPSLPLTQIELMACAYAILNAAIYFFWWYKPFKVDRPIMLRSEIPPRVREVYTSTTEILREFPQLLGIDMHDGDAFRGRLQMPTFDSGCLASGNSDTQCSYNMFAEILTAAVFGGIHLFAWNYQFPTLVESWLWRVSASMIAGIPPFFFISCIIYTVSDRHNLSTVGALLKVWVLALLPLLYIISRLFILILSLLSLRKLPVGTFSNVDWLTFIPHID
ncbi:hypothetical protein Clacol_000997 [Clathrus columnatus]|uniref:Uncharacterized protein n=1 Tax=Clathrus columnatus TaxID=1419009 RepID=A0AAV5A2L5_9AGAM|nr:hypothetical protein Clacol_000997 [Clathrus columnatus]